MIHFNVWINFRWFLRPICKGEGHDWQYVGVLHPLLGGNYNYCKRCGWGQRTQGLAHTPRFCRHKWEDNGGPSRTVKRGEPFESGVPFRQIQRCPDCGKTRCIECATGEVVK